MHADFQKQFLLVLLCTGISSQEPWHSRQHLWQNKDISKTALFLLACAKYS